MAAILDGEGGAAIELRGGASVVDWIEANGPGVTTVTGGAYTEMFAAP